MRCHNCRPVLLLAASLLAAGGCQRDAPPSPTSVDAPPAMATPSAPMPARPGHTAGALAVYARPLAGQAEIGIRSALGNPSACEDVPKGRRCRYAQGGTDVVYVDGIADWIVVDDLGGAPFSAAALARVGLPVDEDPLESTPQLIRWQNLAGFREVTLYPSPDGRAGRIEMKTATL